MNDRGELVGLIKDAGDAKGLKAHLKDWESPTTGGQFSIISRLTSFFGSKESTSANITEAAHKSKGIKDSEFLAALQEKVAKEPLLEQLVLDVVKEAHAHLQEFTRSQLPRLYSRVRGIQRQWSYHQVEAMENNQQQKRRALSRNVWFDEIRMAQAQVAPGYVYMIYRYIQYHSSAFHRSQDVVFICNVEEVKHVWGQPSKSLSPSISIIYLTLNRIQAYC